MKTPRGISVKYVDLLGAVNLGGMHTRNLDAERDLCALHLHQETGGVFVTRGDDEFYIGPHAIGSVQLQKSVEESRTQKVPAAMLKPLSPYPVMSKEEADKEAERVSQGARNLADEVLSELQEEAPRGARKSPRKAKA